MGYLSRSHSRVFLNFFIRYGFFLDIQSTMFLLIREFGTYAHRQIKFCFSDDWKIMSD